MTQKMSQRQCSNTRKEFRPIITERKNNCRVYKANKKGGEISLRIRIPPSKIAKKARDIFFMIFGRKEK